MAPARHHEFIAYIAAFAFSRGRRRIFTPAFIYARREEATTSTRFRMDSSDTFCERACERPQRSLLF